MDSLLLAFALCMYVQQSDPSFMPTECHVIGVHAVQSPLVMDVHTKDKSKVKALVDQVYKELQ